MAMHVKRGDMVMVLCGEQVGRTGKVLSVNPKKGCIVVEGVNVVHRHVRPSQKNPQGGRIRKEMPIHLSNVSPVDPKTGKATRVRFQMKADGSKVRVAARSGESLGVLKKARQRT